MQFFATMMSMAFAVAAVSAHEKEAHYSNGTVTVAPTYGTPNSTVTASGTGAPFASTTGAIGNAAGKLSTSALGLLVVGGVVLAL